MLFLTGVISASLFAVFSFYILSFFVAMSYKT